VATNLFGYVDNCYTRTLPGTHSERTKISLDLLGYESKLAQEYITYNYYEHQSAISPLADSNAFSYRDVIEGFLAIPDSTRDGTGLSGTDFVVNAAADPSGIDAIIDGSCNFSHQTLFEAVRCICEHIGYDGYFSRYNTASFTPTINLFPYSKSSVATLSEPFISEPQYEFGSLNEIANIAFITGGIDAGIPSDGDRLTEFAASKYNPAIWSAARASADNTVADEDNAVFNDEYLRANGKCVKASTTGSTDRNFDVTLNIANTDYSHIDCVSRCNTLSFNFKTFGIITAPLQGYGVSMLLTDANSNQIIYRFNGDAKGIFQSDGEGNFTVPLNQTPVNPEPVWFGLWTKMGVNTWYYVNGASTFDWSQVTAMAVRINVSTERIIGSGETWGCYIDGLQFVGGYEIKPFQWYSETLNPPVKDMTSILAYGMHPIHIQDSSIASFEQAQAEGSRVINNMKDPKHTLTVTKPLPESTQLYPSNVVTVATVDYRIKNILYNWKYGDAKTSNVTYNLVDKTAPLPPIWMEMNELRYFIK
jgi:hypothetical protein